MCFTVFIYQCIQSFVFPEMAEEGATLLQPLNFPLVQLTVTGNNYYINNQLYIQKLLHFTENSQGKEVNNIISVTAEKTEGQFINKNVYVQSKLNQFVTFLITIHSLTNIIFSLLYALQMSKHYGYKHENSFEVMGYPLNIFISIKYFHIL